MVTDAQFLADLRTALSNLYEPGRLRGNPLAVVFGLANRINTFSALQGLLIETIESLQPRDQDPRQPGGWEIYELLSYRYVQQLNQHQVAKQLGMSVRHLRRRERAALQMLAERLWQKIDGAALGQATPTGPDMPVPAAAGGSPDVHEELAWLKTTVVESPCDLNQVLSDAIDLIGPLTTQHMVHIDVATCDLPALAIHPVALSQILLNLLGVAIHRAAGGNVTVVAGPLPFEVKILIQVSESPTESGTASGDDTASLEQAQQLASLCGCRLSLSEDGRPFGAQLILPAREQLPILVIDDNADTLQLLRRYVVDTRYSIITTPDPQEMLSLVQKYSPRIIVLDVMMPHIDGWKLLGQLRQYPLTEHVPVIVCTILAQEEMAFSLGATGFVRKPVTRQAFLAALDHQVEMMATEPR